MDRKWLPLNALRAFDAVGRHNSFTAGAQALNVTQSALSRHVQYLEELIGKKLLVRKPQGVALTEAGATLLPVVSKAFDRIEHVLNNIAQGTINGPRTLRVHVPPTFLQEVGIDMLKDFRADHPDIAIDVATSLATGLPPGRFDIGIVFDRPAVTGDIRDLIWTIRDAPLCAPAVAEKFRGATLEELLRQNELLHVRGDTGERGQYWNEFSRKVDISLDVTRGLTFDTLALAAQYAMAGGGVMLGDIDMFAPDIANGRLAAPFDVAAESGYAYYLSLHPEDLDDPLIALFRSWIIARFAGLNQRRSGGEP